MAEFVVIGGGIVGLATAHALLTAQPGSRVSVLEKESELATHQTGHNSGVIHSGIYYAPGSAKAVMCRAGASSMAEFAERHDVPLVRTGKLIVATEEAELPRLTALYERGLANQIPVSRIGRDEAAEYEPHVAALAALRVESTAIVDYPGVCRVLAELIRERGGSIHTGTEVTGITEGTSGVLVDTTAGPFPAGVAVNCAGLYADRVAAMDSRPAAAPRIVPFRGEYYQLRAGREHLVRGLIYPVPDPSFPFLGVHLTKMVDGSVHAGPNAVLALAREGYRWRDIRPRDVADVLSYPGFWRLAARNLVPGSAEVVRSLSKRRFAASLARLVPEITVEDLVRAPAGVRAQALGRNGKLVDDFSIIRHGRCVHVLNAPSPAATSALEIGRHIAALAIAGR